MTSKTKDKKRLFKNAGFNSVGWGISICINLVATPYLVHQMGLELYGTYILLMTLLGMAALLDFGFAQTVTKYSAEEGLGAQQPRTAQVLCLGICVQICVGAIAVALLTRFSGEILQVLKIPPALIEEGKGALTFFAWAFLVQLMANMFISVLRGKQRYDISAVLVTSSNLLITLIAVGIIASGQGIVEIGMWTLGVVIITFLCSLVLVSHFVPRWYGQVSLNREMSMPMVKYGLFTSITNFAGFCSTHLIRISLGAILGPVAVSTYAVVMKLINAAQGFLQAVVSVLLPFASVLGVEQDEEKNRAVYLSAARVFSMLAVGGYLALSVLAEPLLTVWMDAAFAEEAAWLLQLLAFLCTIGSFTSLPMTFAVGMGHARERSYVSMTAITLYGLFIWPVFRHFDLLGVPFVYLFFSAIPGLVFVVYVTTRIMKVAFSAYFKEVVWIHLPWYLLWIFYCGGVHMEVFPGAWIGDLVVGLVFLGFYGVRVFLWGWRNDFLHEVKG